VEPDLKHPSSENRPEGFIRPHVWAISLVRRVIDACLMGAALYGANHAYDKPWTSDLMWAVALAALFFQLVAPVSGLYRSWRGTRLGDELTTVMGTWLGTVPLLLLAAFLTKTTDNYSRLVMTGWLVLAPLTVMLGRVQVRVALRYFRSRGRNSRRVAIAGATASGVSLCRRIASMKESGNRVVGMYDDRGLERLTEGELGGKVLLGGLQKLVADAKAGRIDVVYIALPLRAERRIQDLISRLADTTATVYVVADLFMFDLMHARWGNVGDLPVVSVFDTPFHGLGGWVKRLEDIVLSSMILILIAIPMLVIAIAIKLTSKGPVFFAQTRYGLNGRPIKVLKFRSMTTCDDGPVIVQAKKGDARITPLGAFLRRTSLDELPQFWNVFTGQMSVVGPRPHAVAHNEIYRGQIRGYMLRHKVKPGITGWAQVNGLRGETEVVEKMQSRVQHDLYYIDNWSLFWDLKIVFLTIFGHKVRSHAV
jgi:putative colanic acid biosysnthesis UDP-glucose lipid carrier transferase